MTDIVVPKWGLTMDEATLTEWMVEVGDVVAAEQSIAEVETDKTINDLPSPAAGTVVALLVDEGATVESGQVIARLEP
ncbi:biotin/lipoyl-containing protein [Nocardioides sp.]|uniref:biotin/lipoyl-containing protein n=1 Tax=Nocardioides sp. TaxID=35761 RepID=UPI003D13DFBD